MASTGAVVVGMDLGGTGCRFLAMDPDGKEVAGITVRTPSSLAAGEAASFVLANASQVARGHRIAAVGIGASGPVDLDGIIRNPDTLPALSNVDLAAAVRHALDVPTLIDNDAVVAAVAEYYIGGGREAARLLHVTLGTGIGTALLVDGAPFRGGDGMHPEGGHVSVAVPSTPCYCGRSQCWEQAASRSALQQAAARLLNLRSEDPGAVRQLASLADSGDDAAVEVFRAYGRALADGLATAIELYRPTAVTLGGSAAVHFPLFAEVVQECLGALGGWLSRCDVTGSTLGDAAGAWGAAFLARRALGAEGTSVGPPT